MGYLPYPEIKPKIQQYYLNVWNYVSNGIPSEFRMAKQMEYFEMFSLYTKRVEIDKKS